jgi:hypothetical protein
MLVEVNFSVIRIRVTYALEYPFPAFPIYFRIVLSLHNQGGYLKGRKGTVNFFHECLDLHNALYRTATVIDMRIIRMISCIYHGQLVHLETAHQTVPSMEEFRKIDGPAFKFKGCAD